MSMFKSVLFLALVFALFGLVAAFPMPMPMRREFEGRSPAVEVIPAYVKRVGVNTFPVQVASRGVNGQILAFETRSDDSVDSIPAQVATKGTNGEIELFNSKRAPVVNSIPAQVPTKGVNGQILAFEA